MKKGWEQIKVDITFIMNTRSSRWWRGRELAQHLRQLGHVDSTPKSIKWVLSLLVEGQYIERTKVKPQWSLYSYRLKRMYHSNHLSVVQRDESNILW